MAFEKIPRPFIRPKIEEEKKESRFNKPPNEVCSDFLDQFTDDEQKSIKARNLGVVSQNLVSGVDRLISEGGAAKGEDYSDVLENFAFDDLRVRRFAYRGVENYEELDRAARIKKDAELAEVDREIKKNALIGLFEDLKSKGILSEEAQQAFENEFRKELEEKEIRDAA